MDDQVGLLLHELVEDGKCLRFTGSPVGENPHPEQPVRRAWRRQRKWRRARRGWIVLRWLAVPVIRDPRGHGRQPSRVALISGKLNSRISPRPRNVMQHPGHKILAQQTETILRQAGRRRRRRLEIAGALHAKGRACQAGVRQHAPVDLIEHFPEGLHDVRCPVASPE